MMRTACTLSLVVLLLFLSSITAQQPPPVPPPLPPINPANARLDVTLAGLDGPGSAIVFNEETGILAASCERSSIQYWTKDVILGFRTGDNTPHAVKEHKGPVTAIAWSGGILASAAADKKLILWSMPEGKAVNTIPVESVIRALSISPDGKTLVTGSDKGAIQLWDVASGKPGAKLEGHTDWVLSLQFSADGKQLASGGHDGIVRLWDVAGAKKILDIPATPPPPPNTPPPPTNCVLALTFSPDGKQLAIGGTDANIHLMNPADGKLIRTIPGHTGSVASLAFHGSGTVLVSGSKDRTVRLWNPANGQALKILEGHGSWVQGVVLVAKGTRIASVSADQTVRVWDMAEPKK